MTLADIKAATRELLEDDTYDGDVIRRAANWFVYELAINNKLRMFEADATLTASAGDTTINFPDDMLAWTGIWITSPNTYDAQDLFMEYVDFMRLFPNFASATAQQLSKWTDFGRAMRFSAPLSAEHTMQIDYVRDPVPMVSDGDDCEIPDRYEEMVARGAKLRIMEIDEDYEFAQNERDILEPLKTAFIRNESRGGGKSKPTIIRTGRRVTRNSSGIPRLGD